MKFLLSNFGNATLTSAALAGETTLIVDAELVDKFPTIGVDEAFSLIIWDGVQDQEIVYVTEVNGEEFTVLRGQEDTTPQDWLAGTQVRNFITKETLGQILQNSFIQDNTATEGEAEDGSLNDVLMTPLRTTNHFDARSSIFTREFLLSVDAVEARRALGWASAVFSGTGLETTFTLPDPGYDTPFTRVYVDEEYVPDGYDIAGDQLVFDIPPGAGVDNIVVVLGQNFAFSISFPGNNTVTEDALVDGAVTAPKLAGGAVTGPKLAANAVSYDKIQKASATDKVLGRASPGSGDFEEIPFTSAMRSLAALGSLPEIAAALAAASQPIPTGAVGHFFLSSAPTGWIKANGQTIGNGASGGTGLASASAEPLFTALWNSTSNSDLTIQTSGGTPTTRGASAAADFAANKRLPLPDLRAEFLRGLDDGRGVDTGRTLASFAADIIKSFVAVFTGTPVSGHTHDLQSDGSANGANASDPTPNFYTSKGDQVNTGIKVTQTTSSAGGFTPAGSVSYTGGAETRPRSVAALACIKL